MNKKAFTLVEVVLAAGMMAVVLGTASTVMYTVLRSARKSAAVAKAKTEGAYALRAIDQMVRFSTNATCGPNTLSVTRLNNEVVNYSLTVDNVIASNSAALMSQGTKGMIVSTCSGLGSIFSCNGSVVSICFVIKGVGGIDVTDYVGATSTDGITFRTQVEIRNFGN